MIPAVLYAAKSTEDRHGSLPDQLRDARGMAEREGWHIVEEFKDEGFSAYKGNRGPGLANARERAAELATEHGAAVLAVQHSDRLARGAGDAPGSADHLAEILFWARRHAVQLRSVQDDTTFTNPLLAFAMGERNYEDSRRKSEAVKGGMRRRAQRGRANGGPRPYGYAWAGPRGDKRLVIEPASAQIVRRIFHEFVGGTATAEIARRLTADGVRAQRGGEWYQGTVSKVLSNPIYAGRLRLNGEEYPGEHEPLIDADAWDATVARRERLARTKGGGRGRPPKGKHLFTNGHLRCLHCGDAMVPRTNSNRRGAPYEVYKCFGRYRKGTDYCPQTPIPRAAVDAAVFDYFTQVGLDIEATRDQLEGALNRRVAEARALLNEAENAERRKAAALERLERDYESGAMPAERYVQLSEKWAAEHAAAQAETAQLQRRAQEAETAAPIEDAQAGVLERLTQIRAAIAGEVAGASGIDAVRAALLRLFDHFLVGRLEHPASAEDVSFEHDGREYVIWPEARPEAIACLGVEWLPILRREPLHEAANKEVEGLTTDYLFGPIRTRA